MRTSNGGFDIFIAKFANDGSYIDTVTFGGSSSEEVSDIEVDVDNNLLITGLFQNTVDFDPGAGVDTHVSNGDRDVYISKFDSNLDHQFAYTVGGSLRDRTDSIMAYSDGSFSVAGLFQGTVDFDSSPSEDELTSQGSYDIFISTFDTENQYKNTQTLSSSSFETISGGGVDANDNLYVA